MTKVEVLAVMRDSKEGATRGLFGVVEWVGVDDIIAATAAELDAQLWTRNLRHFPMLPGLAAPY